MDIVSSYLTDRNVPFFPSRVMAECEDAPLLKTPEQLIVL